MSAVSGPKTQFPPDIRAKIATIPSFGTLAAALGLHDGDPVELSSRHGTAVLHVRITNEVEPGQVFAGFHFPGATVNSLTSPVEDEVTGCPEYKLTAVHLSCP